MTATTSSTDCVGHWIAGRVEQRSARYGDIFDPAKGTVRARVALADAGTVDRAVQGARVAGADWRHWSLTKRTQVLFAFRELIHAHRDDLARVVTSEHGKTFEDARGEVTRGLEVVEFACGIAHLMKGEFSESVATRVDSLSMRQPLGVMAGITPFNFPVMVPMWMYPIAIACGNAFVLKPSPLDPRVSLVVAQLWQQAGLPDGVFTVVNGDAEVVNALLTHPAVDGISFVGSTPVARHVHETASRHGKRVQALGGAKNHALVLPDANIHIAADAIASAAYGSAGQRCMAISVVVAVGEESGDQLVGALQERAEALVLGAGGDDGVDMGPVITAAARERIVSYIEAGIADGADLVCDGRAASVREHEEGFFLGPTLLDRVTTTMSVYRDEVFGQLLIVLRVRSRRACHCSTRTPTRTARRSLPATAARLGSSRIASRQGWWGSTYQSLSRWRTTRSGAGRSRCSAISTSTAERA